MASTNLNFSDLSDENPLLVYAQQYHRAGMCPIPVKPALKEPIHYDWLNLRISFGRLADHFLPGRNIGVVLGDASGGLVDVDLDSPEAVMLGPALLPPTKFVFGHPSKPDSHFLYRVAAAPATKQFKDGETVVELRGNGGFTVAPGSVHEETGALIEFNYFNGSDLPSPAQADLAELQRAVLKIAIGSVLLRNWAEGTRHAL
uniref:bifunctional DNA primase/polymerase n=1 Tax=Pseudomonas sp. TaxID=306 RepID=UPI00260EDD91